MRRILGVIAVLFALSNLAQGQAVSEVDPTIEQLLIEAASKKSQAAREINQSPTRVAGEASRVMTALDNLFQNQIQDRFSTHYKEVEQALQAVSLPENAGSLRVYWEQLREAAPLIGSSYLEKLVEDFVSRATTEIEPLREDVAAYIDNQINETQADLLQQAQTAVRAPFQDILVRYFPDWDVPHLIYPPLPPAPQSQPLPGAELDLGLKGLGGLLLIMLRRKIARMVGTKIAGKVLRKFIPVVGALLIAVDFWDIAQAKAELEQKLREQFLITYQEAFSASAMWDEPIEEGKPSTRQEVEQTIAEHLSRWSDHCREEVEAMLEATQVFAISPNIQDYIAKQTQRGRHTREIVEDMSLVGDVFGQDIISLAPLEDLQLMIIQAPDKEELAQLAYELGARLLREHAQHGREVLVAANSLGVPIFL